MDISTQITGERIAQAVATRARAQEVLTETERQPNAFIVALNVLCFALSIMFLANHFGTRLEAMLGALSGAAFALALASYTNSLRQRKRVEAMFSTTRETAA